MTELVTYDNPFEASRALIRDHAEMLYGIKNASALTVLCEIAFNPKEETPARLNAAKELVKYERPSYKPIEMVQEKQGPDFIINMNSAVPMDHIQNLQLANATEVEDGPDPEQAEEAETDEDMEGW